MSRSDEEVFPVYTGINRYTKGVEYEIARVPCIHRDKPPTEEEVTPAILCSLYTQG